jgi:aminoglycoside phosphotransferase (APT) family kinase protein
MSRDGDAVAPPEELEGLTAEWMTAALGVARPGVEVTSLHFGQTRQGTNTTARLLLGYNRAGHEARLPPTMYAKGAWTGRGVGGTFNEARFYQHIAPQLPDVDLPRCWFASADADSRQAVIVMEDLLARNVILGSAQQSFTPDQAFQLADQLAELHALWFDSPELERQDWLHRRGTVTGLDVESAEEETGIFGSFKEWWWEKRMANGHADQLPEHLKDRLLVKQALVNLYRLEDGGPKCLVHGDPHLGNMFFGLDGRPGIYDWGGSIGRWGHDINYAIIGSLEIEDRRKHERDVLRHYLERLAANGGPAIGWDDAWLSWRRQTIHGFMWVMCSPRQQPEDLIALQTERFGSAAEDHEMLDALDVSAR